MSEKPTPETDAIRDMIASRLKPGQQASAEIAGLLRHGFRLERQRDALADALREYHESHSAPYPPYSAGKEAQDAWVDRIDKSEDTARALLAELEAKG